MDMLSAWAADAAFEAITTRRSVRGHLNRPVPHAVVERILAAAARAPSANNSQPWRVHVLTGPGRQRLTDAIMTTRAAGGGDRQPECAYDPQSWPEPYLARRRANGWELYGLLGIAKGDRHKARAWNDENYRFFGAPVGLILTRDRRLGLGSLIDLGMFMEGLAVAACSLGLDTCPQAALAHYHAVIHKELHLAPEDMVVRGMSLGFADEDAMANRLQTERELVASFATFHPGAASADDGAAPYG